MGMFEGAFSVCYAFKHCGPERIISGIGEY